MIIFTEPGVPEETAKTAWDRMVFSFDLAGASLILYNHETPLGREALIFLLKVVSLVLHRVQN